MTPTPYKIVDGLSVVLIPYLLINFSVLYLVDPDLYLRLLREDGPVEWLTVGLLCLSAIVALVTFVGSRRRSGFYHWFFLIFSVGCFVCALEEISWGQRLFGVKSPEFFLQHSDQSEINAHNVLQKWSGLKTKHVAGLVLFLYGCCFPYLALHRWFRRLFHNRFIIVPPVVLSGGFLIAAVMMFDWPTGEEEELGEFFFGLCFALFIAGEFLKRAEPEFQQRQRTPARPGSLSLSTASGAIILAILIAGYNDLSIAREGGVLTYVSVVLLLSTAGVTLCHAVRLTNRREQWLWGLIGTAFLYLALDEYFELHEKIDMWIHDVFKIEETQLSDQLDGTIVLLYALVAVGVVLVFHKVLRRYPGSLLALCLAFLFLFLMVVIDLLHTDFYFDNAYFEEAAKVISEYCFLLAFLGPRRTRGTNPKTHART